MIQSFKGFSMFGVVIATKRSIENATLTFDADEVITLWNKLRESVNQNKEESKHGKK